MANKLTLDLTEDNKDVLEKLKAEKKAPYGAVINDLISTFAALPADVSKELLDFTKIKLRLLYRMMDGAGDYNLRDLYAKAQAYTDLTTFFNGGKPVPMPEIDKMYVMQKLSFGGGILLCPDDWIIVNPDKAASAEYASVIECRHGEKYAIPHFLYFSNLESAADYNDAYVSYMYGDVKRAWPRFQEVLDRQVKAITDPETPGLPINADEWCAAPNIGIYDVYVQGDPKYAPDYEPPFGARIIRQEGGGGTPNVREEKKAAETIKPSFA